VYRILYLRDVAFWIVSELLPALERERQRK
jgi:hypothetical protein